MWFHSIFFSNAKYGAFSRGLHPTSAKLSGSKFQGVSQRSNYEMPRIHDWLGSRKFICQKTGGFYVDPCQCMPMRDRRLGGHQWTNRFQKCRDLSLCQTEDRYRPRIGPLVGGVKDMDDKLSTETFPCGSNWRFSQRYLWWYPSFHSKFKEFVMAVTTGFWRWGKTFDPREKNVKLSVYKKDISPAKLK